MWRRVGLIAVGALLVSLGHGVAPSTTSAFEPLTSTMAYADGLGLDRLRPSEIEDGAPVVVLVHGCCGDRRDLSALARALARRGAVALNADVHAVAEGGGWPSTYDDVVCAVAAGRSQARSLGATHPVVLLGWSDGALVGATVTLGGSSLPRNRSKCSYPGDVGAPDLFIGVGGHYGWIGDVPAESVSHATEAWFGGTPEQVPDAWRQGVPGGWLDNARPSETPPIALVAPDQDAGARAFWSELTDRAFEARLIGIAGGTSAGLVQPRATDGRAALDVISGLVGVGSGP